MEYILKQMYALERNGKQRAQLGPKPRLRAEIPAREHDQTVRTRRFGRFIQPRGAQAGNALRAELLRGD